MTLFEIFKSNLIGKTIKVYKKTLDNRIIDSNAIRYDVGDVNFIFVLKSEIEFRKIVSINYNDRGGTDDTLPVIYIEFEDGLIVNAFLFSNIEIVE